MKTILTGIVMLVFSYAIGQTDLSSAEYYIDHDPGYGNATPIAISGDTALISEIISNTLELGHHNFYMRVQDDLGNWGMDEAVPFRIRQQWVAQEFYQIDYAEYFINVDPGYGSATEIPVTTGDTIFVSEIITNNLSPGFNTLFIRSRNANNQWGIDEAFSFYVQATYTASQGNQDQIVGLEYFIGDDPGNGNGSYIDLDPGDTLAINEWLASQPLTDGMHQLSVRLQSDSGVWSLTEWRDFEYLNCEAEPVSVSGESEFCIGDSILIEGPGGYDLWSWNTHQSDSQIYATQSGDYYASVYDEVAHQCFLSDTLSVLMFLPPDASFTLTSSFNNIEATGSNEGQNLFWQLNDEFSSTESSFTYNFISDGWQSICLEASNICGVDEVCDTVLLCAGFETPPYFYADSDGDGYGVATDSIRACSAPEGFADNFADCDDNDEAINPGQSEILYNGIDDDCDPATLDTQDADGDGYTSDVDCDDNDDSIYPGATEIPDDGIDQDCDGADLVTGINEMREISFNFYPNPATDKITIEFTKEFSGVIDIMDTRGKKIDSWSIENEMEVILHVDKLVPGLYLLNLRNNENISIKPIVIQ